MIAGLLLASLFVVAVWEYCRPRRRRAFPALRRRCANIGLWLVNLSLLAFLLGSPEQTRAALAALPGVRLPSWPIAAPWLGLVTAFLLLDFLHYLVHRLEHAVPWLWRLHALHHTDPDVDVTTAVRHHPGEYLLSSGVYWTTVVVLGVPLAAVLAHGLAVFTTAAFQHGNIRLPQFLETWLAPALITNNLHRVHHSAAPREANANYGAVLSVWDRMLGTLVRLAPAQHDAIVFGVSDLPAKDALRPAAMLLTPWLLARAARLRRGTAGVS